MRKLELPQYRIYYFKDLSDEILVNTHNALINPINQFHPNTPQYIHDYYKENYTGTEITPRTKELVEKYHYLIHMLIYRSFRHEEWVPYQASVLKELFGNNYTDLINTLIHLGYIIRGKDYKKGEYPYSFAILNTEDIRSTKRYDSSFEKYQKKKIKVLQKLKLIEPQQTSAKNKAEKPKSNFIKTYQRNFNKIKIVDELGARNFIENNSSLTNYAKEYYYYSLSNILENNNRIIPPNPDNDNRIYHSLTNLPKHLKNYINIKFQVDISNSHPLLFSNLLIEQYKIPYPIINSLFQLFISTNNKLISFYNDSGFVHNEHYISILKYKKKSKIRKDILRYLYTTINGFFWDDFMDVEGFGNYPRGHIKVELFREVFYSYGKRDYNKMYSALFKKEYPTVYKIVKSYRVKREDKKNHISHRFMKLESEIFQKILKELFKKNIYAINIHDAIVVLDIPENNETNPEDIYSDIIDVYGQYNLIPAYKTEYFSPDIASVELRRLNDGQDEIEAFYKLLRDTIKDKNHPKYHFAYNIQQALNSGKRFLKMGNFQVYLDSNK